MLEQDKISRIKILLKAHPKGLTITDISSSLKMNRNSAAKYLEILLITGQVESKSYGTARAFFLSHRLPISALVSITSDLVVTLDESNRILFVNEGFCRLFGVKKEETEGSHIVDIFKTGIGCDILPAVFSDVIADQEKFREVRLPRDTGDLFFKIKSMKTVFDDGSRGITIIMEDVTREKLDKIELEAKESRYRGIVEDQTEFIIRFLPGGTLTFVNASYSHAVKKKPEDLLGTDFSDTVYPEDRAVFYRSLHSLSRDNPVAAFECRFAVIESPTPWIAWTLRALFDDKKNPVEYQAVGQDITEKKEASDKLHHSIRQMVFFSKKLQQFIELPPDENIYHAIGAGLSDILPDALIAVSSYDPDTTTVTIRAVFPGKDHDFFLRRIGRDPEGMKIRVGDTAPPEGFRTGKVYPSKRDLSDIFFQQVPAAVCEGIEDALNLGECYSAGLMWNEELLGTITFALRKGQDFRTEALVEAYIRAASICLKRTIAENALKESQNLYRTVIENIEDVFYRTDMEGNLVMASPSCVKQLGYSSLDEMIGRNIARDFYLEPQKREKFLAAISAKGLVRNYEIVLKKKDGTPFYVLTNSYFYYDKDGTVLGIEGVLHDITERHNAEQTHRLLSSIIESTSDAVIGKDSNGRVISWNKAAEQLYGYAEGEMIGQHISRIIPADRKGEMEEIFSRIERGESVSNLETRRIRKDGRVIDVSVTISPITDDTGNLIGASTIARDITRHKAEERLHMSEEQYRSLVENISGGIYRSTGDPTGRFIWGNSSLVRILGYPSLEHLKKIGIADIFVEHDGRKRLLDDLKKEGFVKNREIALRRADGETAWVLVTALARFDKAGGLSWINGIVEDITSQRQAENHVQIMDKQMQDVLAGIPNPVVIVNRENRVIAWNAALERVTGVQKTAVIGRDDFDQFFPFYDPSRPSLFSLLDTSDGELERHYPGAYRNGTAIIAQVRDLTRKEDPSFFFTIRASPLSDPRGERIGAMQIILSAGPECSTPTSSTLVDPGITGTEEM